MKNLRNIGLTTLALGMFCVPAMAEMEKDMTVTNQIVLEGTTDISEVSPNYDFEAYDQNDDGLVSVEEFAANVDENINADAFAAFDTNTDGSLTEEEFNIFARGKTDVEVDTENSISDSFMN